MQQEYIITAEIAVKVEAVSFEDACYKSNKLIEIDKRIVGFEIISIELDR